MPLSISRNSPRVLLASWFEKITKVYISADLGVGFDTYLNTLLSLSQSDEHIADLLEQIALRPERFHELAHDALCTPRQDAGHARELLIQQLQRLAEKFGRTPICADVDAAAKEGKCACVSTYFRYFKSFTNALKAAGLEFEVRERPSRDALIAEYRELTKKLGKPPSQRDLRNLSKQRLSTSAATYEREFGSLRALRRFANGESPGKQAHSTKAELIASLQALAKELGRTPMVDDIRRASKQRTCASYSAYYKVFGSYNAALQEAGLEVNLHRGGYTREGLVRDLQQLAQELGRVPTTVDLKRGGEKGGYFTEGVYQRVFGSFDAALEAAGMEPYRVRRTVYTAEALKQQLLTLQKALGHAPRVCDVNAAKKQGECANASTFAKVFGSFNNALNSAGIQPYRVLQGLKS